MSIRLRLAETVFAWGPPAHRRRLTLPCLSWALGVCHVVNGYRRGVRVLEASLFHAAMWTVTLLACTAILHAIAATAAASVASSHDSDDDHKMRRWRRWRYSKTNYAVVASGTACVLG